MLRRERSGLVCLCVQGEAWLGKARALTWGGRANTRSLRFLASLN